MMRARWSQRWLRSTANLALFAMLAVWTSPALAWHCCCWPQGATASHQVASAHSCCDEEGGVQVVVAQDDCVCAAPQPAVAALPESPFHSQFASLDFVSVPSAFVLAVPQMRADVAALADVAKLRSRSCSSRRGRAPPTFWL